MNQKFSGVIRRWLWISKFWNSDPFWAILLIPRLSAPYGREDADPFPALQSRGEVRLNSVNEYELGFVRWQVQLLKQLADAYSLFDTEDVWRRRHEFTQGGK